MADDLYLIRKSTLDGIANAVQEKAGLSGGLDPKGEIEAVVRNLDTGGADDGSREVLLNLIGNRNALYTINLPGNITKIESCAFYYCHNLRLESLPNSVESIGSSAFYYCQGLAFMQLPENLKSIGMNAFCGCRSLAIAQIPAGVKSIGNGAFRACVTLKSITFSGIPDVLNAAFGDCPNLLEIKVPWPEGTVAGAPWGAQNANIIYDYAEEAQA